MRIADMARLDLEQGAVQPVGLCTRRNMPGGRGGGVPKVAIDHHTRVRGWRIPRQSGPVRRRLARGYS